MEAKETPKICIKETVRLTLVKKIVIGLLMILSSHEAKSDEKPLLTPNATYEACFGLLKNKDCCEEIPPISPVTQATEEPIYTDVEEPPVFPGGMDSLISFIDKNLHPPQEAIIERIHGTVIVSFVVEPDGAVTNVEMKKYIGSGWDEEVVHMVRSMPRWNPGRQNGEPVRVRLNLPLGLFLEEKFSPRKGVELIFWVYGDFHYFLGAGDDLTFEELEEQPTFPGGEEARLRFLRENLRYPFRARFLGIQGTVILDFVVERDGSISNVRVLRGIGGGCDQEAVRVLKRMPRWTPGRRQGEPVRVQLKIPIRFQFTP